MAKRLNFGFYGGRKYSKGVNPDYFQKRCKCGQKALYRAAGKVFCKDHKQEAVKYTRRTFGRYFGKITAELKALGEL